MDGLLHGVLAGLIRTGSLCITTARGNTFTVGDGTGGSIAVRTPLLALANLVWVTIGNMIGGVMVGVTYRFIYLRNCRNDL